MAHKSDKCTNKYPDHIYEATKDNITGAILGAVNSFEEAGTFI
jgi:hypothetical protein